MKRRQLARLHAQVSAVPSTEPLAERISAALDAVAHQHELCPDVPDAARVAVFAQALVGQRDTALTSPQPLLPLFDQHGYELLRIRVAALDRFQCLTACQQLHHVGGP